MSDLAYQMLRIRMIEERIALEYHKQKMRCPVHLSIGQEAAAVGLVAGLSKEDKMVSTHRGHAHYLAKGGSINGLIGELYGKASGCSRGNGGSMHLIDLGVNFFGSTSIVGGTIPVGVGLGFSDKLKGLQTYTAVCIGDAAVEEGVFHESANFASLHGLKVIFACENNMYSCYTRINKRQPKRPLSKIAEAHDLKYFMCKPNDPASVKYATEQAKQSRRACFIEIPTYRHVEHCGPNNDDHLSYRPLNEIMSWRDNDPVVRPKDLVSQINKEIDEAFAHAEAAPYPKESEVGAYVYAGN